MQSPRKVIIPEIQYLKDAILKTHRKANQRHFGLRIQQVVLYYYQDEESARTRGVLDVGVQRKWLNVKNTHTRLYCNISSKQLKRYAGNPAGVMYVQEVMRTTQDLRIQQLEIKQNQIYARQHGTCVKKYHAGH